jgi:hypothetical protein
MTKEYRVGAMFFPPCTIPIAAHDRRETRSDGLWELWKTRALRFPRSGGRVFGVHGSDSFHRRRRSLSTIDGELGHFDESAILALRYERRAETRRLVEVDRE